jgi:hypothetical protein|nr:alpha-2-macroglobulin family protein [Kofleriaceae bacterium]
MRSSTTTNRLISLLALAAFVDTSCGGRGPQAVPPRPSPLTDLALEQHKKLPRGLAMQVTEGTTGAPAYDHANLAPATPLADADAQQLLARTPAIAAGSADQQAFALRASSTPPPRTGQTIRSTFPAPPSTLLPAKATDRSGELRVLRYQPEGKVPIAPELSVTFSQPMVAVTGQTDAAATTPVQLEPTPAGHWRWIGTRTILFDPDVRFPQATTYHATVPAGTKSATGDVLKQKLEFSFETPPPRLVSEYPTGAPQRLDVPMFALFDQRIDPAAVIQHVHLTASGKPIDVHLLDPSELASKGLEPHVASLIAAAKANGQDGRWLAFRAVQPLPKDAPVIVEIAAGTPSAEGTNVTTDAQRYEFQTYPPLKVTDSECGYSNHCEPGMPLSITFDNPLDDAAFDDAQITITPAIPDAKIIESGTSVAIQGDTEAETTYKVTVSKAVADVFGQTLGADTTLSFVVTDAEPNFFGPEGLVVLDPAAKAPVLDVYSTNYDKLAVKLYQVDPSMIDAFGRYVQNMWNHDHPVAMPGKKVFDQSIAIAKHANHIVDTAVDLRSALGSSGLGHAIAVITPLPWTEQYPPPMVIAWVQATKLGLDAHVDGDHMDVMASDLQTGKPLDGVSLDMHPYGIAAKTDARGMASMQLASQGPKGARYVLARRGDDVAFVSDSNVFSDETGVWTREPHAPQLAWYVTDDRQMYKPGEQVSLKGWLRALDLGKGGDLAALAGGVSAVQFHVYDSRNTEIAKGSTTVDAVGGFDARFAIPKTPHLGSAIVAFTATGRLAGSWQHVLQIQEFRTPEFEVTASPSQGPFVIGGSGEITVHAKYYSGGPLGGAPAQWVVNAAPTTFTPPNRDDYVFGTWVPWWGMPVLPDDDGTGAPMPPGEVGQSTWTLQGKTDATGADVLHMDFTSLNPAMPMSIVASATVTDVNRQQWSASATAIVHPSDLYVGLKADRPFVDKGTPYELAVIGVDLDGKAAAGTAIEVKSVRLDWEYKHGRMRRLEVEPQTCSVSAAADASRCTFATPKGGMYQVTATIVDAKGRANQTTLTYWVSGGDVVPSRGVTQEQVQLIPDKKEYADGDTAHLLVQAPFSPAEAIVSWRRSGIIKSQRITLDGPTTTIEVPISDAMTPNLFVQVDMVGQSVRTDDHGTPDATLPKRPAFAVGTISLPVPPRARTLAVAVEPSASKVAPGEDATVSVDVRDARGQPVASSEVAVIVVDEAILALTGFQFASPIDTFYPVRGADTQDYYERAWVQLANPKGSQVATATGVEGGVEGGVVGGELGGVERGEAPAMPEMMKVAEDAPPPPPAPPATTTPSAQPGAPSQSQQPQQPGPAIALRTNFNPLAAFAPAAMTDARGHATVKVKMPDNLTRYRIVAIASAGARQFGKGESAVTARLPLMVRPSPPRFLNFGDTFKLPVVVQNQTDAALTVKVAVRATNAQLTDGAGRQVTVPANDRVEVQFPAAAELAGTARFQVLATSGSYNDAAELALPVWTPSTTEAFATYGVIDDGAIKQPVALPAKVWPQFGGLEITTASTNLQSLTDALLYLVHYPYECAEQRSSRILAIAALRDVLTAFKTKELPTPAEMEASVKTDVEHLSQMQNYDGGFAFWDRGYPSEPYLSVFVANALGHAKAKGFAVPPVMLARALPYLKQIEQHIPSYYPDDVRHAISAYALYTRKQLGDLDIAKGKASLAEWGGVDKVTMETDGWLLGLFAGNADAKTERDAIVRYATNHVSETAGAANFTTGYSDGAHLLLASDRRVDAVMLESLIAEQPQNDLIPKIVTGLLAHRKAGRWLNTQESSFALLALDEYFQTYEKVTPDFVARVWLGKDYAGDHAFKGRSTDYVEVDVAMKDVATHDKQDLTIQKDGKGRLYYRIGMTYAPESLKLEPADYGFVVQRRYEAVDDPKDVTRASDGTWHVKAGARVRVHVTMVNENRRYHVALVDPMPAGFEAMNPALATTGPIPQDPKAQATQSHWWWFGPWYEHQDMRDERVEAFASLLWEGVHDYDYVARATTPGNFVVPPPKAEEMYMPETFGRGASDRVIVE